SYSRSPYPQLPYHPHRHRLHPLPQHIEPHIINRPSYRHSRLPPCISRLPPVVRADIRALGRPIGVHHLRLESLALPPLSQVTNIDRLASQHHAPQAPQTRIAFLSLLLLFLLFLLFLFFLLFLLPLASSLSPSPGLQHWIKCARRTVQQRDLLSLYHLPHRFRVILRLPQIQSPPLP